MSGIYDYSIENLLSNTLEALKIKDIEHGELSYILSGGHLVFSDKNNLLVKIARADRNPKTRYKNLVKEMSVSQALVASELVTTPFVNEIITICDLPATVWRWETGKTFTETDMTLEHLLAATSHAQKLHAELAKHPDLVKQKTNFNKHQRRYLKDLTKLDLTKEVAQEISQLAVNTLLPVEPNSPFVAIHGDLHLGNAIFSDTGNVKFCDLENVLYGEPEYDLGVLIGVAQRRGADPATVLQYVNFLDNNDYNCEKILGYAKRVAIFGMIGNTIEKHYDKAELRLNNYLNSALYR
jgi:thiamine kinase-like enzyme